MTPGTDAPFNPYHWASELSRTSPVRVNLTLTHNRRTMLSVRRPEAGLAIVRLQHGFLDAPPSIFRDLERFILHDDAKAWKRVAAYARGLPTDGPTRPARRARTAPHLITKGRHHDLKTLLKEVQTLYIPNGPRADITWGKRAGPVRRRRRSILFGSWDRELQLIRIHPLLDVDWVPEEFLRYLIHHELCHAIAAPTKDASGRRKIHHPDFRKAEARYPHLQEMEAMADKILKRLIRQGV